MFQFRMSCLQQRADPQLGDGGNVDVRPVEYECNSNKSLKPQ